SWNGLAIAAFADAGRVLADERWLAAAVRAADLLLARARDGGGRLRRSLKDGQARQRGVLDDYSHLAEGLLALYRGTFDERWFVAAVELTEQILTHFADPAGGFFDTADDHEQLIARPKGLQDNAVPSGNSTAMAVLLQLAALTGEGRYRSAAEGALRLVTPVVHRYPSAFAQWLVAIQLALGPLHEVAIVGRPDDPASRALLEVVQRPFRPGLVVAFAERGEESRLPLLHDRPARDGRPTAYVCRAFACRQPVTEPGELAAQLASAA
ncbi:MAG: thioredoxin domain-containing protein, partial [Chloroflexota bacterium]|nr:thioredoxin domain-containing protein [Chloroflexota bacterium]